jgi:hypothetical protein
MEIQTFYLAMEIQEQGAGNYTTITSCVSHFTPADGKFPCQVRFPYLMLLRRASKGPQQPVTLKFNLINQDGQSVGKPSQVKATGLFPAGKKFLALSGHILFLFPAPGDYRLDITADEETSGHLYCYDIEIGPGPAP